MRPLSVNAAKSKQLKDIITVPTAQLRAALDDFKKEGQNFFSIKSLVEFFRSKVGAEAAGSLVQFAFSLRRTATNFKVAPAEVVDGITAGLVVYGWKDFTEAQWRAELPALLEFASDPKIEFLIKASELYYSHNLHIHEVRIITDLRPVFNLDRSQVAAMYAINSLHLKYSDDGEDEKNLVIALKTEDLQKMKSEIETALAKIVVLERDCLTSALIGQNWRIEEGRVSGSS